MKAKLNRLAPNNKLEIQYSKAAFTWTNFYRPLQHLNGNQKIEKRLKNYNYEIGNYKHIRFSYLLYIHLNTNITCTFLIEKRTIFF